MFRSTSWRQSQKSSAFVIDCRNANNSSCTVSLRSLQFNNPQWRVTSQHSAKCQDVRGDRSIVSEERSVFARVRFTVKLRLPTVGLIQIGLFVVWKDMTSVSVWCRCSCYCGHVDQKSIDDRDWVECAVMSSIFHILAVTRSVSLRPAASQTAECLSFPAIKHRFLGWLNPDIELWRSWMKVVSFVGSGCRCNPKRPSSWERR